jgi:hypothetical protein
MQAKKYIQIDNFNKNNLKFKNLKFKIDGFLTRMAVF